MPVRIRTGPNTASTRPLTSVQFAAARALTRSSRSRRLFEPEVEHQDLALLGLEVRLPEEEARPQLAHLVLDRADEERIARVVVVELKRVEITRPRARDEGIELEPADLVGEHA